jgi:hypothetical protein
MTKYLSHSYLARFGDELGPLLVCVDDGDLGLLGHDFLEMLLEALDG